MKYSKMTKEQLIEKLIKLEQNSKEVKKTCVKLENAIEQTIKAMALTVETRDPYAAGHQKRVADLASLIARNMGLSKEQINIIYLAGFLHDLGRIHIPPEIYNKSDKLNVNEFEIIKTHPKVGYDIMMTIKLPWPIAEIILQHHERINGSGYPQGLTGKDIKLESKILSIADVIIAMSSLRPHRPSLGINKILDEIKRNKGILYDPDVADACINLFKDKEINY
ncbi:HD domain-containing protein [Candidatus Desantisbacteria bacterium]|nr:HD domain-containing protein [Candidatus Desantisbacteria bacterium]